ncbi:hypothetical protein [Solirubrobacter soli]|uniref:hypothetical protein n=1 Tax=Solirubrobacter soli TaxID=363832 RepID=UPI0004044191|nr:hypothetical protein [Solirubrobacter soli]
MRSIRRNATIDERERQVRDHAGAVSFRVLAAVLVAWCAFAGVRNGWDASVRAEDVITIVALALIANATLMARRHATLLDVHGARAIRLGVLGGAVAILVALLVVPLVWGVAAADLVPAAIAALAVFAVCLGALEVRRRRRLSHDD